MEYRILIVAGEASADICGADLVARMQKRMPRTLEFIGVGGARMKEQGVEVRLASGEFNVVGISEWLGRAGSLLLNYRKLCKWIDLEHWDLAILIDLPDVNLRLAKRLKKLSIPVCYYVSPQIWAWRSWRVNQVRAYVDKMLVLFPFEVEFYKKHGVDAVFVGHPLADQISTVPVRSVSRPFTIALFPGSRKSELLHHVHLLGEIVARLRLRYTDVRIVVPIASTLTLEFVQYLFEQAGVRALEYSFKSHEVLNSSDVALVASGTATLEAMLSGIPFCVFYHVSRTSKWLYNFFVDVPFISMPNLIAEKQIVKEFFQETATQENVFEELVQLLEDNEYRASMITQLASAKEKLSFSGSREVTVDRAATEVITFLEAGQKGDLAQSQTN